MKRDYIGHGIRRYLTLLIIFTCPSYRHNLSAVTKQTAHALETFIDVNGFSLFFRVILELGYSQLKVCLKIK
jgi:hypothetical protein